MQAIQCGHDRTRAEMLEQTDNFGSIEAWQVSPTIIAVANDPLKDIYPSLSTVMFVYEGGGSYKRNDMSSK
jgi:hypothetical protein